MKLKLPKLSYKKLFKLFLILGFAFLLLLFSAPSTYFQSQPTDNKKSDALGIQISKPSPVPINFTGIEAPNLSAEGIIIIDLPSDMILYQKNGTDRFNPASTTKIMTALVALNHYQLDDILTVGNPETSGRTMRLVAGEKLAFESLLYGALVHSANDAAFAIAENYPGGVDKFVEAMNIRARTLELNNTRFTNPIGFDDINMYTTPYDLARLAKVALNNKLVAKIVGTKSITVSDVDFTYFHPLTNVNELLGRVAGVAGVKTGYTENGGEILVSEVKKNGQSILIVLLKSKDRFEETRLLIDWVFNNFVWQNVTEVIPASR